LTVGNATKFTREGEIVIKQHRLALRWQSAGAIQVRDTIGIAPTR
jgi:hypothetical protein